jgi:hypothetical protein
MAVFIRPPRSKDARLSAYLATAATVYSMRTAAGEHSCSTLGREIDGPRMVALTVIANANSAETLDGATGSPLPA